MLGRLFAGLRKTRETLVSGLRRLMGRGELDAGQLDRLEELLYTADLGPAAAQLVTALREAFRKGELKQAEEVEPFVKARLLALMGGAEPPVPVASRPHVVLVVGVNGSGKTTSIAKLAALHKREGRKVMLAACDTFRAAAVEQLSIWADRLEIPILKGASGADPSGLAFDAADAAVKEGIDVLLVDTAGRLHTQKNLMAELEKVRRVLGKRVPGAPHETLLILDGTTGQNAIAQARQFQASVAVSGLMVTKLDGTARGGAVVSIREQLGLPVRFVGLGESVEDIERFDPAAFVEALFQGA
ncbi:MAG TPA: signal recognition particle-docking protein FtsY [Planctomycetota bacterium]|nr:signal recognition particle-docking protein FtsY [Planctomycetota bacterium]